MQTPDRCGAILVVRIDPGHRGRVINRRAFLGGGAAAVAGLAGGPALLDRRGERQLRELSTSAVPGRRLGQQRLIWSVSTSKPLAALTFDDGPDPEMTPRILEVLAQHGVRATSWVYGVDRI